MPERVLFEAGDPEFEPEKPDPSDIKVKQGRKLIRVGLVMLVLGLLMCLFFIILVVAVVPATVSSSSKVEINPDQVCCLFPCAVLDIVGNVLCISK